MGAIRVQAGRLALRLCNKAVSQGGSIPVWDCSEMGRPLHLKTNIELAFLTGCPGLFHLIGTGRSQATLTRAAARLASTSLPDEQLMVSTIQRLLMMSQKQRVPIKLLETMSRSFGFPAARSMGQLLRLRHSHCLHAPKHSDATVKLLVWDPSLASFQAEKLSKFDAKVVVLPSPYDASSRQLLSLRPLLTVALCHEFLSLTLFKRSPLNEFAAYARVGSEDFVRQVLERHSGFFGLQQVGSTTYVSLLDDNDEGGRCHAFVEARKKLLQLVPSDESWLRSCFHDEDPSGELEKHNEMIPFLEF